MAFNTFVLVLFETEATPFTTRDTVACETPANTATSLTVQGLESPSGTCILIPQNRSFAPNRKYRESVALLIPDVDVI